MKDRLPLHPGRVTMTPVPGQANTYDMVRADQPVEVGDALNKANLLPDDVCAALGIPNTSVPKDALLKLGVDVDAITPKVGDIKTTVRTDLGDDWLLCNGAPVDKSAYPDLDLPFELSKSLTAITSDTAAVINDICYANGQWVAVGRTTENSATVGLILTAQKATGAWTRVTSGLSSIDELYKVRYLNDTWVVVGKIGTTTGFLYSSNPSISWTKKFVDSSDNSNTTIDIAYYDNKWYVLEWDNSYLKLWSATDLSDTFVSTGQVSNLGTACCMDVIDGKLVVGGINSYNYATIAMYNGTDWSTKIISTSINGAIIDISHDSSGIVVLIAITSPASWLTYATYCARATSLTGNWTVSQAVSSEKWYRVKSFDDMFYIVGSYNGTPLVNTSEDAETWTSYTATSITGTVRGCWFYETLVMPCKNGLIFSNNVPTISVDGAYTYIRGKVS